MPYLGIYYSDNTCILSNNLELFHSHACFGQSNIFLYHMSNSAIPVYQILNECVHLSTILSTLCKVKLKTRLFLNLLSLFVERTWANNYKDTSPNA